MRVAGSGRVPSTPPPKPNPLPTVSKVTASIEIPGYRSDVSFPLDADASDAFVAWFEMQLAYLARWKPGSTATIRETVPLAD